MDRNYLIKENVEILDNDGVIQNINEINEMFFLLPLSKKHLTEKFNLFYKKNDKLNLDYSIYYYKDRTFDTYQLDLKNKKVSNPIIRPRRIM